MRYGKQVQIAMEKLDNSLAKLRNIIKRGQIKEALHFMEQGELKDRYEELQNIVTISGGDGSSGIGASGTIGAGTIK
jgi:hypothetical protein